MKGYILKDMTWPEIEEALKTAKVAVVPIGAQEQHGRHLAEGCDSYRAEAFCALLAEKSYPHVVVAPTVNYGISPHHMDFPGTISLRPETLMAILEDVVSSLKQHGMKKFLFVNGHGANSSAIAVASEKLAREYDVEVAHTKFVDAAKGVIQEHIHSEHFGHACEREISESLYMAPHIVRKDLVEKSDMNTDTFAYKYMNNDFVKVVHQFKDTTHNGNLGDGRQGSFELGEKIIQTALDNLSTFIEDFAR
ncbi:Creatininase [Lentibacillus sp. JNUCC-1]|uniref:creatininase family protein n=1 Tax=Lentibacillus sp. JNUCC-1 TaxID=2654513 RepID=UPI0012E7AD39|nr:creatininase family protein [Lentibacillus sp. JNUCC-1]MUV36949.1 Creatininase [Lentibacillus sp. JNUCC-1]